MAASLPVTGSDYCTTQIVASTDQTTTTLLVASPTEPFPLFDVNHTYFYLTIVDEPSYISDADPPTQREIVKVRDYQVVATGYSLTCTRGSGGTTAQIWAVGAVAEIRPCAQWLEDLKSSGGAGGDIIVTDGITTVNPTTTIDFTSGAVVTDLGGAVAGVAITGGGGGATGATGATGTAGSNGATGATGAAGSGGGVLRSTEFTSSGTFTPASGVTAVWLTMIGGGGGGRGSSNANDDGMGGGGAGELVQNLMVPVSGAVAVTIGTAGTAGAINTSGGDGGTTSFGTYLALGGYGATSGNGGNGGGPHGAIGPFTTTTPVDGILGTAEAPTYFGGGAGGAGNTTINLNGSSGAGSGGTIVGGAGGTGNATGGGGGGGAATPWGTGGAGGAGNAPGATPTASHYGAGGGGGGGNNAAGQIGGAGAAGYCLVAWVS